MPSSISLTRSDIAVYFAARVPGLKQGNAENWRGPCPVHKGKDDNFTVEAGSGRSFCHSQCGRGWDVVSLESELCGSAFKTAKAEVFRVIGREVLAARQNVYLSGPMKGWREVDRYPYVDSHGRLLSETIRYLMPNGDKAFRQCRSAGVGGTVWKLGDVERVPYRLPKLLNADTVYLVEGEKDVHTLEDWGLVASCNPGGTGSTKLFADWKKHFRGRHLVLLPDNDDVGRRHMLTIATTLFDTAESIRIVQLPGLEEAGDVSDWSNAGGTLTDLEQLRAATAPIDAVALRELRAEWGLLRAPVNGVNSVNSIPRVNAELTVTRPVPDAIVSGFDLYKTEYPEPTFLFKTLLANGLTILAGRPKSGKSWLTLQMSVCAAFGEPFLNRFAIERPSRVLYCALEEPQRRTNGRLHKLRPQSDARLDRIGFLYSLHPLADGGAEELDRHLEEHPSALVIIDTLLSIANPWGKRDAMRSEYAEITVLRKLAEKHKNAFVLVHHTRKMGAETALDMVAGTTGTTAGCDSVWVLRRQPTGNAILEMTGRETEDGTLALRLNKDDPFGWQLLGEGAVATMTDARLGIVELLKRGQPLAPARIAELLEKNASTVRRLLQKLLRDQAVVKEKDGRYCLRPEKGANS